MRFPSSSLLLISLFVGIHAAANCPWQAVVDLNVNCTQSAGFTFNPKKCPANAVLTTITSIGSCTACADVAKAGYLCKDNKNDLCPAGYYCPYNKTTKAYDYQVKCPEGSVCFPGFEEPTDCGWISSCPEGAEKIQMGAGGLIIFILITICGCCCTVFTCIRSNKQLEESKEANENFVAEEGEILGKDFTSDGGVPPVALEFENIGMHLKNGGACILEGVTGRFPAGALIALMGPSGGGKTTFMNALLGRASYANVSGSIKVNGVEDGLRQAANLMGFVPQDDILHADLSIYQNLLYQAHLRLPASSSLEIKSRHIQHVIDILGLKHIQDSKVGSAEERGISGGQKKRVNIGCELVAMPAIVFMDEPTSGLDGAATLELAQCLSQLQKSGLTICCVIHQPRYSVFTAFSHLLLLGKGGKQVYCGRTENASDYFEELNFRCPDKENPADWMIDCVCGLTKPTDKPNFQAPDDLFTEWDQNYKGTCLQEDGKWNVPKEGSKDPSTETRDIAPLKQRDVPGRCRQFWFLLNREGRLLSIKGFLFRVFAMFFCSLLTNAMFGSYKYDYATLFAHFGGGFLLHNLFIAVFARSRFGDEHLTYFRECKTGISSTAYWGAKQLHQFVFSAAWTAAWIFPLYYASVPMQRFTWFIWVGIWLTWYWTGFANLISCAYSANGQTAALLVLIIWSFMEGIFSGTMGLMHPGDNGAVWFISSMTGGRWSTQSLYTMEIHELPAHVLQFKDVQTTMKDMDITCISSSSGCSRDDLLDAAAQGIHALICLGIIFRLMTLMLLALVKYAQGDGLIADIVFVVVKWSQEVCGCGAVTNVTHYDSGDVQLSTFEKGQEAVKITMGNVKPAQ